MWNFYAGGGNIKKKKPLFPLIKDFTAIEPDLNLLRKWTKRIFWWDVPDLSSRKAIPKLAVFARENVWKKLQVWTVFFSSRRKWNTRLRLSGSCGRIAPSKIYNNSNNNGVLGGRGPPRAPLVHYSAKEKGEEGGGG